MKRISKETWLLILTLAVFLAWKLSTLHFRFGDENVYFYMTKAIRDGLVPYKDFNLADPPTFIYLLTGFSALIGKHFILFKIWPPLFDAGNAVLIFLILKKIGNKVATLGPALYLFSFTILSTSDYVTGAETAIFFMLLAIYLDMRKKSARSGVSWALACLSKLYIAPALIAYLGYKAYKREFSSLARITLAGIFCSLVVLIPFFIIAPHETLANLVIFQLHRPAGLNKWNVIGFFFQMEWPLMLLALLGAFVTKHRAFIWPLCASCIFLLWFKDLYYLYLHLLLPFLAILAMEFVSHLLMRKEELVWSLIGVYTVFLVYPLITYTSTTAAQGIFEHPEEVASALVNAQDTRPIYGVQEAAPLVALIANKPIFQHSIDTNTQNFSSGALNKKDISDDAIKHGIYLIARIADYPELGVTDTGYENYFSEEDFSSCKRYATFPRPTLGDPLNDVAIYRCGNY